MSGNNLFGIKAAGGWRGAAVAADTVEYAHGRAVTRTEQFRAYDSLAESVRTLLESRRAGVAEQLEGSQCRNVEGTDQVHHRRLARPRGAHDGDVLVAGDIEVDAAEGMVKWCRENAALSGLAEAPVRYITDDCLKFVRREIKRGRKYDAIIMDPPTYGRGSTGEMWKLEDHLWSLLSECRQVLSDRPVFFLINAYTARLSPSVILNLLGALLRGQGGRISGGEVGLPVQRDGLILPCGVYGRWEAQ